MQISYHLFIGVDSQKTVEATGGFEPPNKGFADPRLIHLATSPNWSGRRDSNSRPPPWQGGVLPLNYFRHLNGAEREI